MVNVKGELINSEMEWHQPNIIQTTIHTGGAELAGGRVLPFLQAGLQGSQGSNARTRSISQERAADLDGGRTLLLPQEGFQGTLEKDARANSLQQEETHPLRRSTRSTRFMGIYKRM